MCLLNPHSNAVATAEGVVVYDLSVVLRRQSVSVDIRNTLNARVLATREAFLLRSHVALKSQAIQSVHRLYGSYESARYDTGTVPTPLPPETLLRPGDQVCSKHQSHDTHAASVALRPNAVGTCVLSPRGAARVDASGVLLAGREIHYLVRGMVAPVAHTFGCERDWISLQDTVPTAAGVYELRWLSRLPDDNHERAYWFVTRAGLNWVALGTMGVVLSDFFGVGLFHYDDDANVQKAHRSPALQLDAVSQSLADEDLLAGCVESKGNLRSSCNLVCFTLVPGQLTGTTPREIRTLMVHHISLATIADQAQTQPVDRFGDAARRRRLLRGADGAAEKTHQRTRLVLVRSAAAGTAGDQGTKETASEASTTRSVVIGISVAAAVVVFLGVAVWCASEASCTIDGCDSCFHHRRKTKRRRAKIGYY